MIEVAPAQEAGSLLHIGAGRQALPAEFHKYREIRVDIDPEVSPDVVASMLDLGDIGEHDAVYCSHALEHLYPHQVNTALSEFLRALKPGGFALIFVPDLQDVTATAEPLYVSNAGPISGLDLMYGMRSMLEENEYMAHHSGFVATTLEKALSEAGFSKVVVQRIGNFNLMAIGVK